MYSVSEKGVVKIDGFELSMDCSDENTTLTISRSSSRVLTPEVLDESSMFTNKTYFA